MSVVTGPLLQHEQEELRLYLLISIQNTTVLKQWSITQYNKLFFPFINAPLNRILLSTLLSENRINFSSMQNMHSTYFSVSNIGVI
jgi:hypothetical protein